MSSSSSRPKAKIGDIVLLKQGIGVVRYYGEVDFDDTQKYYGIELKGPPIAGGHNGNGYFKTRGGDGRGIFVTQPIRVISSEEILEKLAEIYDILKGRRGHSHFIDRATYDELLLKHEQLKEELSDKTSLVDELNLDNSLLKEQISMMKGTLGDKIDETAKMSEKISDAERKIGSRLSQIALDSVVNQLQKEKQQEMDSQNGGQPPLQIPDYSQTTASTAGKHRKQRSSTTIELDQLNDDFGDIARSVEAFGQKDIKISGPTHYRKFSNTTKQIMEMHSKNVGMSVGQFNRIHGTNTFGLQEHHESDEPADLPTQFASQPPAQQAPPKGGHRARGSMKIGDIVDENGIDYDSDEDGTNQNNLHRDSADEADENDDASNNQQRAKRTRQSRESRQLNDNEVNQGTYFEDELEDNDAPKRTRKSRESTQLDDDQVVQVTNERPQKTRQSRESRQLDDEQVVDVVRPQKTRQSRESRQLDDEHVVQAVDGASESEEDVEPDTSNKRVTKTRAARESRQLNEEQVDQYEEEEEEEEDEDALLDDDLDDKPSNGKQRIVKSKKARGSFQLEQPILSATALETHNGLNGSEQTVQMNGINGGGSTEQSAAHKKSDTMTSDSSAYKAFMSVD